MKLLVDGDVGRRGVEISSVTVMVGLRISIVTFNCKKFFLIIQRKVFTKFLE